MRIAITGATGFLGRFIVARLDSQGHICRCWCRPDSNMGEYNPRIEWRHGELGDRAACAELVAGCDAVVHAALYRTGKSSFRKDEKGSFRKDEGELLEFVERNLLGTLQLIESARRANVGRFIFISSCAVHEKILDDRPLDEKHPTWALSHYGAQKAAVEQFVHSYGYGQGYPICALRPTGIYGLAEPIQASKWFFLVRNVVLSQAVDCCERGGKEVHAADVARAIELLLTADGIAGESFGCYDRYISDYEVATIAQRIARSHGEIRGSQTAPMHEIITEKLGALGMTFGGLPLLERTVSEMVELIRAGK